MNNLSVVSYFYTNEFYETVSSIDYNTNKQLLVTSTGRRHFNVETNIDSDEEENKSIENGEQGCKETSFRLWYCNL